MSKTKNILLTTTAVAGAFVTVTNGQVVKADTPTTPTASQATTTTDKNSVKADYDKAVAEQQQAKQTAADTKAALEKGQKDVTAAQDNVANAEKVVEAATKAKQEATPENIAKTQAQIDAQTKDVATKQDAITVAKQNVTAKEAELKQAKADEDQATADVDASSKTVATEQANVAKAQAAVDGTGAKEVLANEQKAKEQVEAAQADVAAKQTAHDVAKSAHDKAQADVTNAKTENAKAQADLSAKQTTADSAKADLDKVNDKVNEAQTKVDALDTDEVKQTINMGEGYLNSDLENYATLEKNPDGTVKFDENGKVKVIVDKEKFNKLNEIRAKIGKLPENKYKHSERDAKIMVDPIHLSYEQLRDLNIWIVDILNQAQAQLGFDTKFVLTRESINYAKVIADNSTSAGFAHSQSAIDKGAEYVHGADTQGESIATGPTVTANKQMVHDMFAIPMDYLDATTKDTVSLDELKEIIYTQFVKLS